MSIKNWILSMLTVVFVVSCSVKVNGKEPNVLAGLDRYAVKLFVSSIDDQGGLSASGVAVSNKYLVTAAHFCNAALEGMIGMALKTEIQMTFINVNGEKVTQDGGMVIGYDNKIDVCVIEREKHGIPVASMVENNNSVKFGDKAYIVGAPVGIFPVITEGLVSMPVSSGFPDVPDYKLNDRLIISTPAFGGNSGGPVFNSKGQLIGIIVAVFPKYDHVTYCVTIEDIKNFVKALP